MTNVKSDNLTNEKLHLNKDKDKDNDEPALVRFTHWAANYVGIGYVLNAILSVKIYKHFKETKPGWFDKANKAVAEGVSKAVAKMKGRSLGQGEERTIKNISEDFVEIAALGTGGFIVLPLQELYAKNEQRIANSVKRLGEKLGFIPANKNADDEAKEEKKEKFSHWLGGKLMGFVVACSGYVLLKYAIPGPYEKLNQHAVNFANKYLKNIPLLAPDAKETRYYLAEQTAAISSLATLWVGKKAIDKLIDKKAEERSWSEQVTSDPSDKPRRKPDKASSFQERLKQDNQPATALAV